MSAERWQPSLVIPQLPRGEVHVWIADLDANEDQTHEFSRMLSREEQQRAENYSKTKDRDRFIAARGILRALLSHYLNVRSESLRFGVFANGKPILTAPVTWLNFNLSHSQNLGLFAIARDAAVGVDLEWIRFGLAEDMILARTFSSRELASLRTLPALAQDEAFFLGWTRKEALLKATGLGLTMEMAQVEVSLNPAQPARLLAVAGSADEADRWLLSDLPTVEGYKAALAVEGHSWIVRCWRWI